MYRAIMGSEPSAMLQDIQQIQRQEVAERKARKTSKLPPWMQAEQNKNRVKAECMFTPHEEDPCATDIAVQYTSIFHPSMKPIGSRQESKVSLLGGRDEKSFVWNTYELPDYMQINGDFEDFGGVKRKCKFDMACMKLADLDSAE